MTRSGSWWVVLVLAAACQSDQGASEDRVVVPEGQPVAKAVEEVPAPAEEHWVPTEIQTGWWDAASPCPEGATLRGAAPPKGSAIWCETGPGVRHGPYTAWHGTARGAEVSDLGHYHEGEKHGVWKAFRKDGSKKSYVTFRDGVRHGLYRDFWPNGARKTDGWYLKGKPSGNFTSYDDTKTVIDVIQLENGNGTMTTWHANRQKQHEYQLKDGVPHGSWKTWDEGGNLIEELTYDQGKRHGPAVRRDLKGNVIEKGSYEENMKQGTWTENGEDVVYEDGKVVQP